MADSPSLPGAEALSGTGAATRTQRPWVAFCARCGKAPEGNGAVPQHAFSRVCAKCGMGLVLRAPDDAAPTPGGAFLVVDRALAVCAVSEGAERSLGVTEPFAIGRLVSELLVPDEVRGAVSMVTLVRRAVLDGGAPQRAGVRLAARTDEGLTVRVGPCGPPRAAVVVLEP
jgi:hypothetical protein